MKPSCKLACILKLRSADGLLYCKHGYYITLFVICKGESCIFLGYLYTNFLFTAIDLIVIIVYNIYNLLKGGFAA